MHAVARLLLRVGFQETVPADQAIEEAVADWREAVERAGSTPVGEPAVRVITDDQERKDLGEYVVEVAGERTGGDVE